MEGYQNVPKNFATKAIHSGQDPENWDSLCIVPPLVTSVIFKHYTPREYKKYTYSRMNNPTRETLETSMASMENAKHALIFPSGMAAVTAILTSLKGGDHIICGHEMYGGILKVFRVIAPKFGIESSLVDCTDVKNLEAAIKPNTKMLFVETPSNPTLRVVDLRALSEITKKHGITFVVDNTFLTSYLQRPLELGADVSLYSASKYLNGHCDIVMGVIVTNDDKINNELQYLQDALGLVPSPFDCYQVIRSLKTLSIRMKQHSSNGLAVAKYLQGHLKVVKVMHPCLPSHPQYELMKRQTSGHSGAVSFYIKGDEKQATKFLTSLKVFTLAPSLGDAESLACLPTTMTHFSVPVEQKESLGITENLIRLSVGLEDIDTLIADLEQALNNC